MAICVLPPCSLKVGGSSCTGSLSPFAEGVDYHQPNLQRGRTRWGAASSLSTLRVQGSKSPADCIHLSNYGNFRKRMAIPRSTTGRGNFRKLRLEFARQFSTENALPSLTKLPNTYCKCVREERSVEVVATPIAASTSPELDARLSSWRQLNPHLEVEKLKFWIMSVSTSEEILAAATLRAQLFYTYPEFNSSGVAGMKARLKHELECLDLMKSRVKSEFQRDSSMQLLDMKVNCLLAVCEESMLSFREKRNPLISLPSVSSRAFSSKPMVAIGTLDIQDGTGTEATVDVNALTFQLHTLANAPKNNSANRRQILEPGLGHSFLGSLSSGKSHLKHGYIFNLCVSDCVRRRGVATALMREALQVSQQMQLQTLYVHVEANNQSALALYQKLGYTVEEEESIDVEERLQRPRRILLRLG